MADVASPEISVSPEAARPFWFRAMLLTAAMGLTLVAAFNWWLDPFQLFRPDRLYVTDDQFQRYVNAGLILNAEPFDAIVVGTSYSGNFDPALIDSLFGTRSRVISVYGASQREQTETLALALATRPEIRTVFFEVPVWSNCSDGYHPFWPFPTAIYKQQFWGRFPHLVTWGTTRLSVDKLSAVISGQPVDPISPHVAEVHRWFEEREPFFGDPVQLQRYYDRALLREGDPRTPVAYSPAELAKRTQAMVQCFRDKALALALEHPDIEFYFYNPPAFQWINHARTRLGRMQVALAVQEQIASEVAAVPNARYFDFFAANDRQRDCRRWVDMMHFDLDTSNQMLRWMREGTYERTPESNSEITQATLAPLEERVPCGDPQ